MEKTRNIDEIKEISDLFTKEELETLKEVGVKIFAKSAGVSPSYVLKIRDGKRKIKSPKSKKAVKVMLDFLNWYINSVNVEKDK